MSPYAGEILVGKIMPIIAATVPRVVRPVGSETIDELVQDGAAIAAAMLDSAERRGQPLLANSTAFYTLQQLKHGRRSYGATRTDAMCPAVQLDDNVTVTSMDEDIPGEQGDELTMHDLLAGPAEDPSQQAAREIDWAELLEDLNARDIAVLQCTVNGGWLDKLAAQFGVSSARLSQLKRELGRQVKLRWGPDALVNAIRNPAWNGAVRARREKSACQHDRALDQRGR